MKISSVGYDDAVLVRVDGDIDLATAEGLLSELRFCLTERIDRLIVDLAGVAFFGSAGVHVLEAIATEAGRKQVRLTVTGGNAMVLRVLALTGLDRLASPWPPMDVVATTGSARMGTEG